MDTISSERNTSYLPILALVAGVVGLGLGIFAIASASKASKAVETAQTELTAKIDGVSGSLGSIQSAADKAARDVSSLARQTQGGFDTVGGELASLRGAVTKLEEAAKAPPPTKAGATKSGEPVVAGPGEYVIKSGDTGAKIARAQGFALADLQAVNPGVNWTSLKVGQKIKLPKK